MKTSYKIRFHLARGENYMKWQIRTKGSVEYVDPRAFSLLIFGATLKNRVSVAKKINDGANKSVCAWIDAKGFQKCSQSSVDLLGKELRYNPRVQPNWVCGNDNFDRIFFERVITNGNKIFIYK